MYQPKHTLGLSCLRCTWAVLKATGDRKIAGLLNGKNKNWFMPSRCLLQRSKITSISGMTQAPGTIKKHFHWWKSSSPKSKDVETKTVLKVKIRVKQINTKNIHENGQKTDNWEYLRKTTFKKCSLEIIMKEFFYFKTCFIFKNSPKNRKNSKNVWRH